MRSRRSLKKVRNFEQIKDNGKLDIEKCLNLNVSMSIFAPLMSVFNRLLHNFISQKVSEMERVRPLQLSSM